MRYALTYGGCGCLMAWDLGIASIITEVSGKAPLASDYDPIITEDERLIFPENTTEMSDTGTKISEFVTAPGITAMSYFTGVIDNGDDTFSNYNFTPDQLITYVASSTRQIVFLTEDMISNGGATITIPWADGKTVQYMLTQGKTLIESDNYEQFAGGVFNLLQDTVFVGQKIILYL